MCRRLPCTFAGGGYPGRQDHEQRWRVLLVFCLAGGRRRCERMHCRGGLCRGVCGLGSSPHLQGATFSCATCMNLHGRIVKPQSRRSLKRLQLPLRPTCSYSAVKSRIPEPELKPSRLSSATTMASCRRRPPAMSQCLAYFWVFGHWWPNSRFKFPKSRTGVIDRTLPRSPCSLSPIGKSLGENEKLKAVGGCLAWSEGDDQSAC